MNPDPHVSQVAKLYDALASNGPYGTLAPRNRGGRKSRYVAEVFDAALVDELLRHAPGGTLLDYGCGTGIFSLRAAPLMERVVGVDVSPAMLDVARGLADGIANVEWLLGDGSCVPLADASVDWAVARESLCYVPTDRLPAVVADIVRVLRPGGRLLWLEQTSDDPRFQASEAAELLEKRSVDRLLEVARSVGLRVEKATCVRTPRFPLVFLAWFGLMPTRMIPRLGNLEARWQARFGRLRGRRWRDVLLVLRKPTASA